MALLEKPVVFVKSAMAPTAVLVSPVVLLLKRLRADRRIDVAGVVQEGLKTNCSVVGAGVGQKRVFT